MTTHDGGIGQFITWFCIGYTFTSILIIPILKKFFKF